MKKFLICNLATNKSPFLDNLEGKCSKCGVKIHYRPHAPKKTIKICITCFNTHYQSDDTELEISSESLKDLKNLSKN